MPTSSPLSSGFPNTAAIYSRQESILEVASSLRMEEDVDSLARAARSWERAIKEYNAYLWKFNRQVVDITFSDAATDGQYDLPTNFKKPERAILLDSSDREREELGFVPFEDKVRFFTDEQTPSNQPRLYTAFNVLRQGKIRYWPVVFGASTYPKARHIFFSEIDIPAGSSDKLIVPVEVEEAILQLATAKFIAKMRGGSRAVTEFDKADALLLKVMKRWAGYPDPRGR